MPRPPIENLPAELLGKIFVFAVFTSHRYPSELDRRRANPYNITLVSRYWRDVAYSTPQLWVILPGQNPRLWERIAKRSGTLPLCLRWHKNAPGFQSHPWSLEIPKDPRFCGRLQGLKCEFGRYNRQLKGLLRTVTPSSSLRHVHMEGEGEYHLWNDYNEFLTFIQGLPNVTYLGLGRGCIPSIPNSTLSTPQIRFGHPNLRGLYLSESCWKVLRFLAECVPLQTLESLNLEVRCTQGFAEIKRKNRHMVFRDFWEGRKEAPRSLAVSSSQSDSSGTTLEIVLGQCQVPGHGSEYGDNTPFLKCIVTGSGEPAGKAWENLVGVLPLADVEEVTLRNFQLDREALLLLAPQIERIDATDP